MFSKIQKISSIFSAWVSQFTLWMNKKLIRRFFYHMLCYLCFNLYMHFSYGKAIRSLFTDILSFTDNILWFNNIFWLELCVNSIIFFYFYGCFFFIFYIFYGSRGMNKKSHSLFLKKQK